MKKFLSKYSLRYPRSLVYMLQASEYDLTEFFKWVRRVSDFNKVEERKHLVPTLKALLLYVFSAVVFASCFAFTIFTLVAFKGVFSYVFALVSFLLTPLITLYFTALFSTFLSVLQRPVQNMIINGAKEKLSKHKGLKIAIAGSYGKTSMKEILKTVFLNNKKVSATPDNKNTPLGISRFVDTLKGDEEILIFEMGEYFVGDIAELCEIVKPDIGIITGINEAHLDKFESIEKTTATIFELADFLKHKENTKLFVNGDNRLVKENTSQIVNAEVKFPVIYSYGENGVENLSDSNEGHWKAEGGETNLEGLSFVLKNNKGEGVVVRSKMLGLHQVGPLSLSALLAQSFGIKLENIELALHETKPFSHRLEPREESGGVTIIDDSYNGSPDGVRAAINFLKQVKNKRRFYVTPGLVEMGEKTEEIHKQIGRELAEAGIEKVVLVRNSATPFIETGLKEHNFAGEVIWFDTAKDCFSYLSKQTINNDLLLYQNDWPDNYA